jgi:hypothetical protein
MQPLIASFDRQFITLDRRSRDLLSGIADDKLFAHPIAPADSMMPFSCGEYILRSAAMVEKTFGGITARLWDDPFEWTLPEELEKKAAVVEYLDEVEQTRVKGFAFFTSDVDLSREIPAPEKLRTIHDILVDTIALASHYQGRAFALFQVITGSKLPPL